jgi:signal transduction histidine kinase
MSPTQIRSFISIIIGIIFLLLISTLIFSLNTISKVEESLQIQVHTRTTIIALKDNLTYVLNAETGQRGFLITSDSSYLHQYEQALKDIGNSRRKLKELLKNDLSGAKDLAILEQKIDLKLARMRKLIAFKTAGDEKTINEMLLSGEGKFLTDNIQTFNVSMQQKEETLFEARRQSTNKNIANSRTVFLVEGIFALGITVFLALIIITELNRRNKNEKRIIKYNQELQIKNKEIEQFAYIASHDLQEPLRSITNFTRLLDKKLVTADDETKKYSSFISGAATRMSNLIFDLLEYSRIGRDTERTAVNCDILVKNILKDLETTINEKNATIRVDKLPVVNGYSYLKSLFQNLISNAIKFVRHGERPFVHISCADNRKEFLFSIRDNGIGIEKIYQERIFVIFQRLHTRTEYPGTGIGLSQCKKIVDLHGGKIWIESEVGKGSTFYFTIPKA